MILPVSLTYTDLVRLIKYCIYVVAIVAIPIALYRHAELQQHALKVIWQSITTALAIPLLLIWGLSKLEWKYPSLAFLMGKRMVHGLWWGEIKSEFKESENSKSLPPIPIAFVVQQSYFFLTIQSYTPSLPARSTLEMMVVDPRSSIGQIQYVFEMRRLQNAEDKITIGYGDLQLTSGDSRLEGYYWNNSPTRGHIWLNLVTRDFSGIGSFADAQRARDEFLRNKDAVVK